MATNLNGKTAGELRAMIESKEATKAEVLAYLVGKGENIRKPSRILREELAGVAKPVAAKPVAAKPTPTATAAPKVEAPKATAAPTATPTPAALAVALEALRAATAAVEALLAAQAVPTAKPVEPVAEPVAAPTPAALAVEPVADEDEDDDEDHTVTEDEIREHLAGLTVKELREMLDNEDLPTTGKREVLTERLVAVLCPPPVQATANKPAASKPAAPKSIITLADVGDAF